MKPSQRIRSIIDSLNRDAEIHQQDSEIAMARAEECRAHASALVNVAMKLEEEEKSAVDPTTVPAQQSPYGESAGHVPRNDRV